MTFFPLVVLYVIIGEIILMINIVGFLSNKLGSQLQTAGSSLRRQLRTSSLYVPRYDSTAGTVATQGVSCSYSPAHPIDALNLIGADSVTITGTNFLREVVLGSERITQLWHRAPLPHRGHGHHRRCQPMTLRDNQRPSHHIAEKHKGVLNK